MKVLVTGGAGFIGKHVMMQLRERGHRAICLDIANWTGDVRRSADLDPGRHWGVKAVIHLAGLLGTSELFTQFEDAVETNIIGTRNVLEFCRASGAAYVGITIPKVWANVYQATKACDRILATAYHESFGVPVSHVLAFNAYGPGQKHGPKHPQKIIPTFATLAHAGEDIPVWGDGNQTTDLVHVSDVAKVLIEVMRYGDDLDYDAGTGMQLTVNEVAEYVIRRTGSKSKIVHLPMRDGEREGTILGATWQNWDRLRHKPRFSWEQLGRTVDSYKP